MKKEQVRIGTSGYSYKHWAAGVFYPPKLSQRLWLEFYARHFDTVELNVTFYRQLRPNIFSGWRQRTPEGFVFTIKGSRFITHIKRLTDSKEPLQRFFDSARELGEKLRLVLWQLPPSFKIDVERLDRFCVLLKDISSPVVGHVFEFRDQSWFCKEIYHILEANGCHLCVADSPRIPAEEQIISEVGYLRFHGAESMYGYDYSEEELRKWARRIRSWKASEIFVYFNNDLGGYAVKNAVTLKGLLSAGL